MDTRGNIHQLVDDPLVVRELEKRVGKLVPIPAEELATVEGMTIAARLAWRREAERRAALPSDERRRQKNAAKRERRKRRAQ